MTNHHEFENFFEKEKMDYVVGFIRIGIDE